MLLEQTSYKSAQRFAKKHLVFCHFFIPELLHKCETCSKADGMSRLGMPNPLLDGKTHEIEVEVINLDSLFLGVSSPVGALMMDIEGFEIAALQGGLHFLKSHLAKAIVIEVHPNAWDMAGTTRADFEQILIDCGLKAVSLSGQIDALAEYGHIGLEPV